MIIFLKQIPMRKIAVILFLMIFSLSVMGGGDDKKLFSLFPVPLKSAVLRVKLNVGYAEPLTIELRNLIGRKLQEKTFPVGSDEIAFNDMDTYPNGLYVIIAKDSFGKIVESTKFIIDK
jgi:hypothetical protein